MKQLFEHGRILYERIYMLYKRDNTNIDTSMCVSRDIDFC